MLRIHQIAVASCLVVLLVVPSFADDSFVAPYPEASSGFALPSNAVVHAKAAPPSFPPIPAPNSPAASVSFLALGDDGTRIPPDTMGAVGPNHVMTMLNSQVRIQNRTGTTNYSTVTLDGFWSSAGSFYRAFDPRVTYDPYSQRWIATACADPPISGPPLDGTTSALLIGVSQTSDPTGAWYRHRIDVDATNAAWADYPAIGFNKN